MRIRAALLAAVLALAGCTGTHQAISGAGHSSATASGSMTKLATATWTGETAHYGAADVREPGIVYQPDVVFVGGGSSVVRTVSANGLLWTIDAAAPNASQLAVGKIMMLTTFGTGRVLGLKHVGADVQVLLGPASLTDIVHDGTFASAAPIPITRPLYYSTDLNNESAANAVSPFPAPEHSLMQRLTNSAPQFSAPALHAGTAAFGQYTMIPFCCAGGIGVHFGYKNAEGVLSATLTFEISTPTVSFHISVGGGHLVDASVYLHGGAGLKYDLSAATTSVRGNVKGTPIQVPGVLTIPIAGPFSLTISQAFTVTMQIGGAGTIKATGTYKFAGDIGFSTTGGPAAQAPVSMASDDPPVKHVTGAAIAPSAVAIGYRLRATVGAGIPGLSFGIFGELQTGFSLAYDGSPMSPTDGCATTGLDVADAFGVGYAMPAFVAGIVNAVIGLFGAKPIPAVGGKTFGPFPIWNPAPEKYCIPRPKLGG